jgi:hypothetical protein
MTNTILNYTETVYYIGEIINDIFEHWDDCETLEEAETWLNDNLKQYPDCIFVIYEANIKLLRKEINLK